MAPPNRNDRHRGHPYPRPQWYTHHRSSHGGRQDSSNNHGGRGRGGQGWDQRSGNRHYTNNRPEDNGRGHSQDEQARATRHDNDGYARLPEWRTVRDVAEPQLKPLRVTSEQQDDQKVAAAAGAFVPEQNIDENIDPDTWEYYKQKLLAQIPPESEDKWQFEKNMELKIFRDGRIEGRKELIVAEMVEKLKKERKEEKAMLNEEEIEDVDEMEERLYDNDSGQFDRETEHIEEFIKALPSCLLLTAGFCAREEGFRCFCPCSAKAKKWRELAKCSLLGNVCSRGDFKDPNALFDHICEKGKTDILHAKVKEFLMKLFADYCAPNLSHQGLYKKGSSDYDKALAHEKREQARITASLQKELEEIVERAAAERKLKEDEKVLEKVNPDKAEMLKDHPFPNESPPLSLDDMIPHYKRKLSDFWSAFGARHSKETTKLTDRTIKVKHNFSLQDEFEKWSKSNKKQFPYIFLFQDTISQSDVGRLLSKPTIVFEVDDVFQSFSAKVKEEEQAIDEGGPETQFFSQVWQMMPQLKVSTSDGSKSIALFESNDCGYSPMTNAKFDSLNCPELCKKAELYYRALGRLFVNCLSMGRTIPDEVLPAIFRNAIMRGCMPTSLDYCLKALYTHVLTLGWNKKTVEHLFQEAKDDEGKDTLFREGINKHFIEERSLWLDSFTKGVTLNGRVPISVFYSLIPLQAVNRIMFGTQKFMARDVINRLHANYSEDKIVRETQVLLFSNKSKTGALSAVLMNMENKQSSSGRPWLQCFLEFCTGQWYLPHSHVDFAIEVIFEEKSHENDTYDGSTEKLQEKLMYSVEHSDEFSMH